MGVGVDHWKSKHILATMRAFLCLALLVVVCEAVFQPQMTDFTAKRCELKLFGIPYFKGINDVVTDDVKVRKTYVDDKSLYTSGNCCWTLYSRYNFEAVELSLLETSK